MIRCLVSAWIREGRHTDLRKTPEKRWPWNRQDASKQVVKRNRQDHYGSLGTKAHAWAAVWRIICMTWLVGQRCGRCLRLSMKRKQIRRQTLLCDIAGDLMSDNEGDEALWWLIIITSPNALQSLSANDLSRVWLAGMEHDEESLKKCASRHDHIVIHT